MSNGEQGSTAVALREEGGGVLEAKGTDTSRGLTLADRRTERFLEKMETRYRLAKMLTSSGLLPRSVNTPEKAMTIMLKGYELGVPPMQSFSSIHVVNGNPTLSGALMMALAIRDAGCKFAVERKDAEGAEVRIERPGWEPYTASFTNEDAERVEIHTKRGKMPLLQKDNWQNFPTAMYFWRAVSDACRTVCPDILAGMHTPEEIEPSLEVDPETGGLPSDGPGPQEEAVAEGASERTEELRGKLSELRESGAVTTGSELAEEQASSPAPEQEEEAEGQGPAPEPEGPQQAAEAPEEQEPEAEEEAEEEPAEASGPKVVDDPNVPAGFAVTDEGHGWYLPRKGGPEGEPLTEQKEDGGWKKMRRDEAVNACMEAAASEQQEESSLGEEEPNKRGKEFFEQGLDAKELRRQIGRIVKAVEGWGPEEIDRWARVTFSMDERIVAQDGSVKLSALERDDLEVLRDQIRDGAKALKHEGEDLLAELEEKLGF